MRARAKWLFAAYIMMLVVIFVLPFYSVENYSILRNTTSELGAQQTVNAWVMNLVFCCLGLTSVYAGWTYLNGFYFQRVVLLVFGGSLALTALFSQAPINKNLNYSISEDQWHSFFATLTGFSFTLLTISIGFIKKRRSQRFVPVLIGIIATLLSLLMLVFPNLIGIWQRLMFIVSFGWLLLEINKQNGKNSFL